ncbi:MAG: DNA-directed RNA polymerase subunit omega [Clostridiales bacterium]|nr:DNA-directed RNA polymerase subunit omega [Clostridiales bacterium]
MKYPLEALLKVTDNRYALVEVLSQRSRELRKKDETILISTAIDQSIDELLADKIDILNYEK